MLLDFGIPVTNINNQTLGVSGRIMVYDNKIKGNGLRVYEFMRILFSNESWIWIGVRRWR